MAHYFDLRIIQVRDGEWRTKKFFSTPQEKLNWITIYIDGDNRPDRGGCTRDDFEQKWCPAFMNVGRELGVKIGRPLQQVTVRGYADFYDEMERRQKSIDNGKDLRKKFERNWFTFE